MGNISQKLTYLNGTKTKIREGLNSLGADLDTEDTFRSYADAIEGIYEDYPKITGEGESLSLDNTKQASMQIEYKGQTSQNGTPTPSSPIPINVVSGDNTIEITGKNLFDFSIWEQNATIGGTGASGTISNGTIHILNPDKSDAFTRTGLLTSGTLPDANKIYAIQVEPSTDYTFSFDVTYTSTAPGQANSSYYSLMDENYNFISFTGLGNQTNNTRHTKTITTTATTKYLTFRLGASQNYTSEITYSNIILEKGSTATTYEPHIGNSYPIYLGGNVFKLSDIEENKAIVGTTGVINSSSVSNISGYVPVIEGLTYRLTFDYTTLLNSTDRGICYFDKNKQFISGGNLPMTNKNQLIVIPSGIRYVRFSYDKNLTDINFTTDTTPIELCKIGTYQDYIYKDNGSWYLHKEIGKVVFNGSETTRYDATNKVIIYEESNIRNYNAGGIVYCNYYLGTANGGAPNQNLNAWNGNSHNINIKNNDISTINDFKTWLSTHNTIVYYILATPTNTEITDTTLLEQLEESKLSYISQTNISQENNDLPFNLDVKALRGE